MLQTYYDINKKDKFEQFFHDTWILKNPTGERAKYMILYFNFSAITKDKDKVQEDFNQYCIFIVFPNKLWLFLVGSCIPCYG